VLLQAT